MDKVRIGVDVGGTFTDCLLVNSESGKVYLTKVPTEPRAPSAAVITGVTRLLAETATAPDAVTHISHGTTLATNTVIEETGDRVGVLVTRGFRDVLRLGRLRFPDTTNLRGRRPPQLISSLDVREVTERIGADGEVVTRIDEDDVVAAVSSLVETRQVQAIVISFLHSYRNNIHERAAKLMIEKVFPELFVSCSADIWRRPREYGSVRCRARPQHADL